MLADYAVKVKKAVSENKNDLMLGISFFLVVIIAFGLGRISVLVEKQRKTPIIVEHQNATIFEPRVDPKEKIGSNAGNENIGAMLYVGSRNSNKYHLPDCPGALRIKEENKIWFSSKKEAEDLGYTSASNCAGL